MSGQAHKDHGLKVGDRCIIEVDEVNRPTGLWWGRVTSVGPEDWKVEAVIDGGKFHVSREEFIYGKPVLTDERKDQEPSVSYYVLPDTDSVRALLQRLQRFEENLRQAELRLNVFREDTAATFGRALQIAGQQKS